MGNLINYRDIESTEDRDLVPRPEAMSMKDVQKELERSLNRQDEGQDQLMAQLKGQPRIHQLLIHTASIASNLYYVHEEINKAIKAGLSGDSLERANRHLQEEFTLAIKVSKQWGLTVQREKTDTLPEFKSMKTTKDKAEDISPDKTPEARPPKDKK